MKSSRDCTSLAHGRGMDFSRRVNEGVNEGANEGAALIVLQSRFARTSSPGSSRVFPRGNGETIDIRHHFPGPPIPLPRSFNCWVASRHEPRLQIVVSTWLNHGDVPTVRLRPIAHEVSPPV